MDLVIIRTRENGNIEIDRYSVSGSEFLQEKPHYYRWLTEVIVWSSTTFRCSTFLGEKSREKIVRRNFAFLLTGFVYN